MKPQSTGIRFPILLPKTNSIKSALDKAGAYGVQEWIGYIGVTGLKGSYYNVMGLPIQRLYTELKNF